MYRKTHWLYDRGVQLASASRRLNLIRNEEERAKGFNPLERIISISEEKGKLTVLTTDEKLSQRIGRELKKAYQGRTRYRWSEDTKCLRVVWIRE